MCVEVKSMKLYLYEVRDDERELIEKVSKELGVEISCSGDVPTPENAGRLSGYDAVSILGQGNISAGLLQKYSTLGIKYLSTRTIGYNHIDLAAAKALGVSVCNADYPPNGVADFTVMLILMCLRHYKQAMWRGQVNDFALQGLQGRDMSSLTIGVLGTGRIGTQVLKNLSGFGCRLLAYNRRETAEAGKYAQFVDMDTLFRECDVISLHLPLTPETNHIINAESIAKMKDGVIIVNCARGELTDIDALIDGIETLKIGALGMDTIEGEEGIIHLDHRTDILANRNVFYLHQFRNVVMTQHMAFYTQEAVASMVRCGIEGVVAMAGTGTYRTKLV